MQDLGEIVHLHEVSLPESSGREQQQGTSKEADLLQHDAFLEVRSCSLALLALPINWMANCLHQFIQSFE